MKIEAGKYYKTRDGRKVGPMVYSEGGWPWSDNSLETGVPCWTDEGLIGWNSGNPEDLIAEWTDGPVRTVTRREVVPGVYGALHVWEPKDGEVCVSIIPQSLGPDALKAAAAVLLELAGALE